MQSSESGTICGGRFPFDVSVAWNGQLVGLAIQGFYYLSLTETARGLGQWPHSEGGYWILTAFSDFIAFTTADAVIELFGDVDSFRNSIATHVCRDRRRTQFSENIGIDVNHYVNVTLSAFGIQSIPSIAACMTRWSDPIGF